MVARWQSRRRLRGKVRYEDQQQINEFGRLNTRLLEIRDDKAHIKVLLGIKGMWTYFHTTASDGRRSDFGPVFLTFQDSLPVVSWKDPDSLAVFRDRELPNLAIWAGGIRWIWKLSDGLSFSA